MTDLRHQDALARETALAVTRSFIVRAPAGSGKTELLVRRFLALLAVVDAPESVLAITFTRKAAAEMRDRIVTALRAAEDPGSVARSPHPRTLELARAALAMDRSRDWDLLGNPARLRIQTIDSLNYGLARRLPLLSGLGAAVGVEEDARELYRIAAERLLEHLPIAEGPYAQAVTTLLTHLDNRVARFVDLVVAMLARRDSWGPILPSAAPDAASSARLRAQLESARAAIVSAHLSALVAQFPRELLEEAIAIARESSRALTTRGLDTPLSVWAGRATMPGAGPGDVAAWLGLASLLLTEAGTPRSKFTYKQGVEPGPAGAALRARVSTVAAALTPLTTLTRDLNAVRRLPGPHYEEYEWRVLEAQLVVLRLAAAELEIVFSERRLADYARIAEAAIAALGTDESPTDTALALDARLAHVLVDEFQDTSEAQVRLLARLTAGWQRGDGRTLFLVGDPMQSIYRFRQAEVGLYLDVRDRGIGDVKVELLTLAVNFRSTRPVVEWINRCFERVLPSRDDEITGAVRYSPCIEAEGAGEGGGVQVHPLFRRSRLFEARQVADVVEMRLAEDRDATVGILVQGRAHLIEIVAELASRGVPFHATDIDPLGERPAVLDLLALTRAIAHPADRTAWLAVLRAPWCGLALADLHALCSDDLEATLPELLRDPVRRARLTPEAESRLARAWVVLEGAAEEFRHFGLRDAVERAWLALGGPATVAVPRELDEAQAYLDALATLEERSRGPLDLSRLATALERLYAPSRPDTATRVQLLTVHKAKGLEFDTVIVPGLEHRGGRDEQRLLQWAWLPGLERPALVVAPVAGAGEDSGPLYRWCEALEANKLAEEKRRLLYVAATRARRWLHLFGTCRIAEKVGEPPVIVQPATSVALGMLWPVLEPDFAARRAEVGAIEGEEAPERSRGPPLRRLPIDWRLPLLVSPRIESSSKPRAATQPLLEFDWASETARHVGTVVHRELVRLAGAGAGTGVTGPEDATRRRYNDELAELGVPADRRAVGVERVVAAVQRTLEDERGRWLVDPRHASADSELALTGRVDGEVVSVVIDRTFVDETGIRWIVDYKTSSHEGAGLEAFLDSEQERYRSQLARYAALVRQLGPEPVRLGLYFPLLSAWRTWA